MGTKRRRSLSARAAARRDARRLASSRVRKSGRNAREKTKETRENGGDDDDVSLWDARVAKNPRASPRAARRPDAARRAARRNRSSHKEYRQKKTRKNRTKKSESSKYRCVRNLPERFPHSPVRVARLSHEPPFRATATPSITMYHAITLCLCRSETSNCVTLCMCDDKKK